MQRTGMSRNTINPSGGDRSHPRDAQREAANALQFWQALEYMSPQEPPKVKLQDCVWKIAADAPPGEMPWADPKKIRVVNSKNWKYKGYQLFAGIVDGPYLVESARAILGAPTLDTSERKPPAPAACVVFNVDSAGLIDGEVFVSALPWAMATLAAHRGKPGTIDFKGFFGLDQMEERIRKAVRDLLFERKLIAPEELDDAAPASTSAEKGENSLRPVSPADLSAIADLVFRKSGWVPEVQEPFRAQAFRARDPDNANDGPVTDDPLNSFFAQDLERVSEAFAKGDVGAGLARYLAGADAPGRIDLDRDVHELIGGVHPSRQPRGCWPSKHPLVTAQQFAVNTALRELNEQDGLFAVNGPPGTGKTTMLKDIAAALVVQRADVLAQFDNPAAAFKGDIAVEGSDWPAARLDERLRGFGIVVASANNGAVENISKDFPSRAAVVSDTDLDYFSVVADSAAAHPKAKRRAPVSSNWGLFAAVLGNKGNRNLFAQRFWFEGFAKKSEPGQPTEPAHPLRLRSLQELLKSGHDGALPWANARERYRAANALVDSLTERANAAREIETHLAHARTDCRAAAESLEEVRTELPSLITDAETKRLAHENELEFMGKMQEWHALAQAHERAARTADSAAQHLAQLQAERHPGARDAAVAEHTRAEKDRDDLRIDYEAHRSKPPSLFAQLFRTSSCKQWNARSLQLELSLDKARADASAAYARLQRLQVLDSAIERATDALQRARNMLYECCSAAAAGKVREDHTAAGLLQQCEQLKVRLKESAFELDHADRLLSLGMARERELQRAVSAARRRMHNADQELAQLGLPEKLRLPFQLASLSRETLHSTAPYFTEALFDARRAVFCAAMELHKSFIAAAWARLRKSLSLFVNVLTGAIHPDKVAGGVAQLWDAFFLVVPLVSTTFASFPRLFNGMGRESIAWLLIDEAGQAAPQQAVGAIWRARRTVLVGDPRQLEPVVGVPEELIAPLLERCGAEPQWAPPQASAQTLGDRATRYGMYTGDEGQRLWIGSPLLVHRRCLDPMFSIANSVAYNDKMVYGTGSDEGEPGIGASRWFDIPARQSDGHWIQAQADYALDLVARITGGRLRDGEGRFMVYIVTPFRVVSKKIQEMLSAQYDEACKGMAGTVHTFQGKEAEHVIFLLGGDPQQPGVIASFAGKKPNLLNVAVTRARRRLYVIGDRAYWTGAGDANLIFRRMADRLQTEKVELLPPGR